MPTASTANLIRSYQDALPIRDNAAADLVGFPQSHARAFAEVAKNEQCVIISREVGTICTRLIEEGYDSKGFRIKAKSCNWGPMAGFVCRDPRFSKRGAAPAEVDSQEHHHDHALNDSDNKGWRASTSQICLSQERLDELVRKRKISPPLQTNTTINGRPDVILRGFASGGDGDNRVTIDYVLHREQRNGETVWAIYILRPGSALRTAAGLSQVADPCLGMVNPYPAYAAGHYKNCVTGDYDLFAIWPTAGAHRAGLASGEDRRMAGMGRNTTDAAIIQHEDPQIGNITNRVHLVAQLLNSQMAATGRYPNRDMVHHSDEGGRPFVDKPDLPLIGFLPLDRTNVLTVGLKEMEQVKAFASFAKVLNYTVFINKGWTEQLGSVGTLSDAAWQKQYTWNR